MNLIAPKALLTQIDAPQEVTAFVNNARQTIRQILERQDKRLLIIVGPCSIHNVEESLEFARRLKILSEQVHEECFLVMRAYIEKPRTSNGWRGLVHDPSLNGTYALEKGLSVARSFLLELAKLQVPAAMEFLTPVLAPYFQDLISWGCIGARTSPSSIHRLLASSLPLPMGFKNTVEGDIDTAIQALQVARSPQVFPHINDEGRLCLTHSPGNPHTHIVLRGSHTAPNYDKNTIQQTLNNLRSLELPPRLLVDCSHGNCQKQYYKQKGVFYSVLEQIREGNPYILGMMLESQLEASSQLFSSEKLQSGVSITDPCLDFASTEELITSIRTTYVVANSI